MYRIDEFIQYYHSLEGNQCSYDGEHWVNMQPLPYYNCIGDLFTKRYWRERKQRKKDAKAVLQGKAVAVTWESEQ
jgi:hypothetical protein